MITFNCLTDLEQVCQALENLKKNYPNIHKKLVEMVYLTRALNFKFQYMGALLMDKDPSEFIPNSVHDSVLRLYNRELQALKDDSDFHELQQIISKFAQTGFTNISHLLLGTEPESLVGPTVEK